MVPLGVHGTVSLHSIAARQQTRYVRIQPKGTKVH